MYSVDKIATGSRRVRLVLTAIIEHFYLMPAACRAWPWTSGWGLNRCLAFPLGRIVGISVMAAGL